MGALILARRTPGPCWPPATAASHWRLVSTASNYLACMPYEEQIRHSLYGFHEAQADMVQAHRKPEQEHRKSVNDFRIMRGRLRVEVKVE